jgi:hypothetical protein
LVRVDDELRLDAERAQRLVHLLAANRGNNVKGEWQA